jgi:hypothetical protein
MNKTEPLRDFRFVKVGYRLARPTEEAPQNFFDISIGELAGGKHTFSVADKNGDQFAAELDVLAALIRARKSACVSIVRKPSNFGILEHAIDSARTSRPRGLAIGHVDQRLPLLLSEVESGPPVGCFTNPSTGNFPSARP